MESCFKYVPTQEEKDATYSSLISKIYSILTKYEEDRKVDEDYINWLCVEIQTYNKLYDGEMNTLPGQLILLTSKDIKYSYIRKIVLDSTNLTARLLNKAA